MRLIFAGTPDTAVPALDKLHEDHDVIAVLTRAPAPVGRKRVLTKSAVHQRALELGLPVLTPVTLRDADIQAQIRDLAPDAIAVVAYGLLIPQALLDVPTRGWLNLHFSLLPRWRGAAPVQYAIAHGDGVTGTAVFQIEAGLDTGPIFAMEERPISETDTAESLLRVLAVSGAAQLSHVIQAIADDTAQPKAQVGEPTHAPRLTSQDARIDWSLPARSICAQTRGWWPAPGAWTELAGRRIKLGPVSVTDIEGLEPGEVQAGREVVVGTGTTAVKLGDVGPAGKAWMDSADWVRGLNAGARFDGGEG
ncbi:methionyl-tRNA formyltransferase [Trueperella pyogenes]|uniref:methionyl-tRNA formyltransferase n=1 Tax=Trueperella pyogenes TaxID=1661 RepID=UPI000E005254|nr:methionyl-tRNA formyltransferase [Trueperella pyogenes]MBB3024668.1 methionyl-tRNA formyltransferase [Trueperella pyogenes]SUO87329.1 Methionyl-tRNA formyltransferase [Trueperella pyogenes]